MITYLNMLQHILDNGEKRSDRTGVGTIGVFGYQMRFDLRKGFPLLTSKKLHTKSIVHELIWFLRGDTNIKYLNDNGVTIWNEWADANGNLGPVYGSQWRAWGAYKYMPDRKFKEMQRVKSDFHPSWIPAGDNVHVFYQIDQIANLINDLKNNKYSRRHIVTAWNPVEIPDMALPPCHCLFQFYVSNNDELSCQLYQRSADAFFGVPFNIASYALLVHMVAQVTGLKVGEFIHTFGDLHIYLNLLEQVEEQLSRRNDLRSLPRLHLNPLVKKIDQFVYGDIKFHEYDPLPAIKGQIAV